MADQRTGRARASATCGAWGRARPPETRKPGGRRTTGPRSAAAPTRSAALLPPASIHALDSAPFGARIGIDAPRGAAANCRLVVPLVAQLLSQLPHFVAELTHLIAQFVVVALGAHAVAQRTVLEH